MAFLSEFVYLGVAFERIMGTEFMAYLEIEGGPCYLGRKDLKDLANFNVMIGINVPDELETTESEQPEDRDDGDELRREDDNGPYPEG